MIRVHAFSVFDLSVICTPNGKTVCSILVQRSYRNDRKAWINMNKNGRKYWGFYGAGRSDQRHDTTKVLVLNAPVI